MQVDNWKKAVPGDRIVEKARVTAEERTGSVFGEVRQFFDETEGKPLKQAKYAVRPLEIVERCMLILKHNK